jgi:hypothetical protein
MRNGCLWNSFVMVGRVGSFLDLIRRTQPELFEALQIDQWFILVSGVKRLVWSATTKIPDSCCNFFSLLSCVVVAGRVGA